MIDISKYKIADDVVWIWNDSFDAFDEEKKEWVNGVEHANWQLWEYKECPADKGGYPLYRGGEDDETTYEPHEQLIPDIPKIKWNKMMEAIQDIPFLIREIERLHKENRFVELERQIALDNREAQVTIRLNQHYLKQHARYEANTETLLAEVKRLRERNDWLEEKVKKNE